MGFRHEVHRLLTISAAEPALLRARHTALLTQVPVLYLILVVNVSLLALAHHGSAPAALTLWFPLVMAAVCARRGASWLALRGQPIKDETIVQRLRQTTVLGGALGIVFVAWALALYQYGDATQRGHVIFFIGITAISCVLCLTQLALAAMLVTSCVAAPFVSYLMIFGAGDVAPMAINLLVVVGTLMYVLYVYNRDFAAMIATQQQIARKQDELQALSDENQRLANRDSLTDLANRRLFFHELGAMIEARGDEEPFHVGIVDLDGFKPINDSYGHAVGDEVLREVGRRLEGLACKESFYARLGGDEFALIVRRGLSEDELKWVGEKVCAALRAPYHVNGLRLDISGTLGIARFPDDGATPEALYERADYALYHAKQARRGGMFVFTAQLKHELQNGKTIEQTLARADLDKELYLEFQPIFDVDTGRPTAFEALARWEHPELGRVPPDAFIRAAERSPLIHRVTRTLLAKALEAAREWPQGTQLSFNLSMRDLTSREAMLALVAQIEATDFPHDRIVLEITESALMRDYEVAREALDLLKGLGVQISLDDFGTGYSSLSYVHKLPLDKIKIDRSFVRALSSNHPTRDIIRTILSLCSNLKLSCIVEGMETPAEVDALRALGCTNMQGFYFARPMSARETHAYFTENATAPVARRHAAA
jgi:diguanylate cyclase (GGDEF)-like protein